MQDLGYYFTSLDNRSGAERLVVQIHEHPTFRHFDPEKIQVSVIAGDHSILPLTISLPWYGEEHFTFTAGKIHITDRVNKSLEVVSLGGNLSISKPDDTTLTATFDSEVPLFSKGLPGALMSLFATEVEILLAQRKAAWANHPEIFEARLAKAQPKTLYWYILRALKLKFDKVAHGDNESIVDFMNLLNSEQHHLLSNAEIDTNGTLADYL